MADYPYFYNSENHDRVYDADSFEEWLRHFFTTGVFTDTCFVRQNTGMKVTLDGGYCNIRGKVMIWDNAETLTLQPANSTYGRIDTVVIERNDGNRNFYRKVVTGTYSANPRPTEPIRTDSVYQLVVAQITVSAGATSITQASITDTRPDVDLCGYVAGTVKEMNFAQFAAQFRQYYDEFVNGNEQEFTDWFNRIKGQLSTDAAGNLQQQILQLDSQLDGHTVRSDVPANADFTKYTNGDGIAMDTSGQEHIFYLQKFYWTDNNQVGSKNGYGTVTDGTVMKIPYIEVDRYGRVTDFANPTFTFKDTTYSRATSNSDGLLSASLFRQISTIVSKTDFSEMYGNYRFAARITNGTTHNFPGFVLGIVIPYYMGTSAFIVSSSKAGQRIRVHNLTTGAHVDSNYGTPVSVAGFTFNGYATTVSGGATRANVEITSPNMVILTLYVEE